MDSWDNPAFEAMQAYHRTAALTAAVKLDVVTLIGGGATSEALAEKTTTSIRGMRILVRLPHSHWTAVEAERSL